MFFCLQFGIPQYVVTLRHDCTHHSMPSLGALKCAVRSCLQWLMEHYWEAERQLNYQREDITGKFALLPITALLATLVFVPLVVGINIVACTVNVDKYM